MPSLKLAVITDIHYGRDSGSKLGSKAGRLLERFIKAVDKYKPAAIIDMGDRVTASSADEARRHMTSVKNYFNRLAAPVHSLLGNHDIKYLSTHDNEEITGSPARCWSRDEGDYHFIFINMYTDHYKDTGLHFEAENLQWLKDDLEATAKPTIVFCHVPLTNMDEDEENIKKLRASGNPFYYQRASDIRRVMEDSGKVVLCMSGHIHRNRYREINGIHYISQQSLIQEYKAHQNQERERYHRVPHGAWSWVEADEDKIVVKLQGKVRNEYRMPLRTV